MSWVAGTCTLGNRSRKSTWNHWPGNSRARCNRRHPKRGYTLSMCNWDTDCIPERSSSP